MKTTGERHQPLAETTCDDQATAASRSRANAGAAVFFSGPMVQHLRFEDSKSTDEQRVFIVLANSLQSHLDKAEAGEAIDGQHPHQIKSQVCNQKATRP